MSNAVQIPYYEIANTIYMAVRDSDSKVWNTVSEAFEVWSDGSIASYVINATYKGGNIYAATFPAAVVSGDYVTMLYIRSGLVPVLAADAWIGNGSYTWDITTQTLSAPGGSGGSSSITYERSPKVQVKRSEGVTVSTVPADIVIEDPAVKRTSGGSTSQIKRNSSSQIG